MSGHRKAGSGAPYWVCACGGWTWADRSSCHGCGRRPDPATAGWLRGLALAKPGPAQKHGGARGDGGSTPTEKATLEEWMVQPRGKRNQARARARAAEATEGGAMASARARSPGRRAAPAPAPAPAGDMPAPMECQEERRGEDQQVDPPNLDEELLPDAEAEDQQFLASADGADEQTIEGWIRCIEGLPSDPAMRQRKLALEARLDELRKARAEQNRNPTLQLLRAQAHTRRRERQRDAAEARAASLEDRLAEAQARLDEARLEVQRADLNLEEARGKEAALRAELAPTHEPGEATGPPREEAEHTLRDLLGLWGQLEALPAAAEAGNLPLAHGEVLRQAKAIITRLTDGARAEGTAERGGDGEEPDLHATPRGGDDDEPAAELPAGAQAAEGSDEPRGRTLGGAPEAGRARPPRTPTSGRRGTTPTADAATSRSRSRGSDAAEQEREEDLLRQAAAQPGQRRLDAWFGGRGERRG